MFYCFVQLSRCEFVLFILFGTGWFFNIHTVFHQFRKFLSNFFLPILPCFHSFYSFLTKLLLNMLDLLFFHLPYLPYFSFLHLTMHMMDHFLTSILQMLMFSSTMFSLLFVSLVFNSTTIFLLLVFQYDSFSTLPIHFSSWTFKYLKHSKSFRSSMTCGSCEFTCFTC